MICSIFRSEGDDLVGSIVWDCGTDLETEPPKSFSSPFVAYTLVSFLLRGLVGTLQL